MTDDVTVILAPFCGYSQNQANIIKNLADDEYKKITMCSVLEDKGGTPITNKNREQIPSCTDAQKSGINSFPTWKTGSETKPGFMTSSQVSDFLGSQ